MSIRGSWISGTIWLASYLGPDDFSVVKDVLISKYISDIDVATWYVRTTMWTNGPLTRYVILQVAHAPGMPGTFSPAADFKGNRWLAIPACITARAWRTCRDACRDRLPPVTGKTFPAFPAHAHPQFCVSGKRPMVVVTVTNVESNRSVKLTHDPAL